MEEPLLSRVTKGDFGSHILERVAEVEARFLLLGEDNILLKQMNPFSVVTGGRDCVIMTADCAQLFRYLSEGGQEFIDILKNNCESRQRKMMRKFVVPQEEAR
jgi:hypothetical protein